MGHCASAIVNATQDFPSMKAIWDKGVDLIRIDEDGYIRSFDFDVAPPRPMKHFETDLDDTSVGLIEPIAADSDVTTANKRFTVELSEPDVILLAAGRVWDVDGLEDRITGLFPGKFLDINTFKFNLPKPKKPQAKATAGKLVTTYDLLTAGNQFHHPQTVGTGYASIAEAKQAGVDLMNAHPGFTKLEVEARVTREGSKALATIGRPADPDRLVTITGTVDVRTVKQNPRIVGWLVTAYFGH
ncbi:hypothetical protein ACFVAJ_18925 [Agromyces sp. NPDC057679]|uniref:hypothetical protein n=1 Tax=Agromyces sp. NPDC057679 TaxID=3346207 RepID=UPI00366D024D